jgi:hypothetical protein
MPHIIEWCGFLGAWLLVAGPLDQAVREIEEAGFEHEALEEAKAHVEEPPPVSKWWLLVPPIWWLLDRKRESIYRHRVGEAMADEDLLAFLTVKDILNAWLYVAIGAALIAVKETWELHEAYHWPEAVFWVLVLAMPVSCITLTVSNFRRRRTRPHASTPD